MIDVEFLQRKLGEIAEEHRASAHRQLDDAPAPTAPMRSADVVGIPDVNLTLAQLKTALDEMARFYLRLCQTENETPARHLVQFETEASAAATSFAQLWYATALVTRRAGAHAAPDIAVIFDELQERAAELVRAVSKDVAHGYVGQERFYSSPAEAPTPQRAVWLPIVEKVTVDLLAKIIVGVLLAAGGALIVYLRVL